MFEARLHDTVHGSHSATAPTPEAAIETAFRKLADSWRNPDDPAPADSEQQFYGDVRWLPGYDGSVAEVWQDGEHMLGTVRLVR